MTFRPVITIQKLTLILTSLILAIGLAANSISSLAFADSSNTSIQKEARISFTFDDGLASTYTNALPILNHYGISGTDYVPTGCIDTFGTCPENPSANYMTWQQVQSLYTNYGWEIGSHTIDTPCLADSAITDPADCPNAKPLTTQQIDHELSGSKAQLASHGITATDFALPYGDYNNNVIAQVAKYYASMRQFQNANDNTNTWPYSDYYLWDYPIQEQLTPVSDVEAQINNAIANKTWLILTFHDIYANPSQNPDDYQYGSAELSQIAAYAKSKIDAGLLQSVHVDQGLVTSSTNLIPNSNFAMGISDGWTTDQPNSIFADSNNNGSYPNPKYSIEINSGATTGHLFSPKFSVNPYTKYMIKSFLDLKSINSGGVGYYIDEYNAQGQWISGQWKTQETNPFVEDMNYTYTPSSPAVASASLQFVIYGSGIHGYIANPQVFPIAFNPPQNMMPNYNFSQGISAGWTTDSANNIYADANNNGAPDNPTYSVSLNSPSTSENVHLFAPKINVVPSNTYNITNWVDIKSITSGCIGFYIDEYNAQGQWISGQYKFTDTSIGSNNVGFTYTPSSTNVSSASLQVIVVGNSGIHAYIDDVIWSQKQ